MLREQRISVKMKTDITRIQGLNKIEAIYFNKETENPNEKKVEFFVRPDIVIAENGVG